MNRSTKPPGDPKEQSFLTEKQKSTVGKLVQKKFPLYEGLMRPSSDPKTLSVLPRKTVYLISPSFPEECAKGEDLPVV